MKFLHLSDLHIGKKLNGFTLIEDQRYILEQTLAIAIRQQVGGVIIAGDVYDSSMPSTDAVLLLDWFLTQLLEAGMKVFIIAGNHDSPERLSFCGNILKAKGLYIAGVFDGKLNPILLNDEYGKLNIYMMPFVRPEQVRIIFGMEEALTHNEAVKLMIDGASPDKNERNIIIAHQFVTKQGVLPLISDSETRSVGSLDNVDYQLFDKFDYTALGHLHAPQRVGRDNIVYGGSPLKYSISERFQEKSAVIVNLLEKGNITILKEPLLPLRDVRQIKGPLEELISQEKSDDYVNVVLTDVTRHLEPYKKLRAVYKNCISVAYENELAESGADHILAADGITKKSHRQIFEDFYFEQNDEVLDSFSKDYIEKLLEAGGEL